MNLNGIFQTSSKDDPADEAASLSEVDTAEKDNYDTANDDTAHDVSPDNSLSVEESSSNIVDVSASSLTLSELRKLFDILKKDHSDVLSSALETLMNEDESISTDINSRMQKDRVLEGRNKEIMAKFEPMKEKKGCYLYYDSSSAKLKLKYTSTPIPKAIGFYTSPSIPAFKYKKNFGRADLIGNCASGVHGRKQFYSGICQFIRAARKAILSKEEDTYDNNMNTGKTESVNGELWMFPREEDQQGLDIDIYMYDAMATYQTILLPMNEPLQDKIANADAVTCLPKHSDVFEEVKQMELNRWLVRANSVGANIRFSAAAGPTEYSAPSTPIQMVETSPTKAELAAQNDVGQIEMEDIPPPPHAETKGCYMLYDPDSCALKLKYSSAPVRNAIGFYCAGEGHTIRSFKFTKNFGRADLIGNCASGVTGRKNYYSGWCQFIRAARAVNGPLWIYPRNGSGYSLPGLDVDIYVYYKHPEEEEESLKLEGQSSIMLEESEQLNISNIDAVACLPKHADFFSEVKTVDLNRWMTKGNTVGATSRFE